MAGGKRMAVGDVHKRQQRVKPRYYERAGVAGADQTRNLTDANSGVHNVSSEDVRPIPGGLGFAQVTFRLPNSLPAGTCQVKVVGHNLTSNVGAIRIQ